MHQLQCMLDASISQPPSHLPLLSGLSQPNLEYAYWLRVNQLIRAWLSAIISRDMLSEVCDLTHSLQA